MKRAICFGIFWSIVLLTLTAYADPVLISLSPNQGMIGAPSTMTARYLNVDSQKNNRIYINGVLAPVRRVYSVSGSDNLGKLLFIIPPNVTEKPIESPLTVPVEVEVNGVRSNSLDFTILPGPMLSKVEPASGNQGESMNVELSTVNTRFRGRPRISFGHGITVSNVVVNSPTSLTASIEIADDATLGLRDVTVMAGRMRLIKTGAFTVSSQAGQGTVLSLSVDPAPSPVFSGSMMISGRVNKEVPVGGGPVVQQPAVITSLVPASAPQGQVLTVDITGINTHFDAQSTDISFGTGITVLESNITSPERLTARIKIAPDAVVGDHRVIATTNSEEATSVLAFNIEPGTMAVTGMITDQNGDPIAGAVVSVEGFNIHVETDSNGLFTLTDMPSGNQVLVVNARDFAPSNFSITGLNGQHLELNDAPISLSRKAAPLASGTAPNIYNLLSTGANRLVCPGNVEKAKELVVNTIVAVGGKTLGVLDEDGRQLNTEITGNGTLSLTSNGLEQLAKNWAIGEDIYHLADAFFFFNIVTGWTPEPPSYQQWLDAFNNSLANIWNDPTVPGHSLFIAVFNKGSIISDTPPRLTLDTTLNPLQMYLLVNSFVSYVDETFFPAQTGSKGRSVMVAALSEKYRTVVSDIGGFIMLADDNDNGSGGESGGGERQAGGNTVTWQSELIPSLQGSAVSLFEKGIIEKIFTIDTGSINQDYKMARALSINEVGKEFAMWSKVGDFVSGAVSGLAGSAMQNIYTLLLQKMEKLIPKYCRPRSPILKAISAVKTPAGMNVMIKFSPSPGDHHNDKLPKYYYAIYRKGYNEQMKRLLVKPSSFFPQTNDGDLIFIDTAPPMGGITYYIRTYKKRSSTVPPNMDWGGEGGNAVWSILTGTLPAGGYVLNLLQDVLASADKIYHSLIFQFSDLAGPFSVVISSNPPPPSLDIAVDPFYNREYLSNGSTGYIYVNTQQGWQPFIHTSFAKPHQKGLTIDSNGWLYTENAASEDKFGGRIFGFKEPFNLLPELGISGGNRFYLGSVTYYSYLIQAARPVQMTDMRIGHWNSFLPDRQDLDPESIGILDYANQRFKILNRRYGHEPTGYAYTRNIGLFGKHLDNLIAVDSHLAQTSNDVRMVFFNSGNNIYYFSSSDPAARTLFDNNLQGENPFLHISDLIFDDDGNLYVLDSERNGLYVINAFAVDKATFLKEKVPAVDICRLPYVFNHPLTMATGADRSSMLVADTKALRRIEAFVPYYIPEDQRDLFNTSTLLAGINGSYAPVSFGSHNNHRYLLLPRAPESVPVSLVIKPKDPEKMDKIILVSRDNREVRYPADISSTGNTTDVTMEWREPEYFDVPLNIPASVPEGMVIKNISLPTARLVEKGQETAPPDPVVSSNLVVPLAPNMTGASLMPLVLFSPKVSKINADHFTIKGVVTDNSSQVSVLDDRGQSYTADIQNRTFTIDIPQHQGRNLITAAVGNGDDQKWKLRRSVAVADSQETTLTGVVVDIVKKLPLKFARIQILENGQEIYTDAMGYYALRVPLGKPVTLRIFQ